MKRRCFPLVVGPLFAFLVLGVVVPINGIASAQGDAQAERAAELGRFVDAAITAFERGDVAEAIASGQRALRLAETLYGPDDPDTLATVSNLGNYYRHQGDFTRAEPLLVRALQGIERALGRDDPNTIAAINDLAEFYRAQARFAEAEPLYRRAIESSERVLGADNPETILSLNNLAMLYHSLGRYDEAEPLYRRALERSERAAGRDSPNALATASNLAELLRARGRLAEAEPLLLRVLQATERTLGRDHADTLATVQNLAVLYRSQGRLAEAEPLFVRSLRGMEGNLGAEHPVTLAYLINLGELYVQQARFAEAEPLIRRASTTSERVLGADHPTTLDALNIFGGLYSLQGRLAEAELVLQRVLAARERSLGAEHPHTVVAVSNLGTLYLDQERYAEAEPFFDRALQASERSLGADHQDTLTIVNNLALVYRRQGRLGEAEPLYRQAVAALERTVGGDHPLTITAVTNLAVLYEEQGQAAEAERLYRRVLTATGRSLGRDHPAALTILVNLAGLYGRQNRWAEAEPLHRVALENYRRVFGADHPATINAAAFLAMSRLELNAAAGALEPARLAAAGMRARRSSVGGDPLATAAQTQQRLRESMLFTIVADAAWTAGAARSGMPNPLGSEAFTALQDAVAGATDQAIVRMAIRRLADDRAAGLGALVREREALDNQWATNNADYIVMLAATEPEAVATRDQLRADRTRIETRMREIDARLRQEFPEYFELVRPQAVDLATAQQMLGADEAVLLIVPTPRGTHTMAVTRSGSSWVRSEATEAEIDATVQRLLWDVGANVTVPPERAAEWERQRGNGNPFDRNTAYQLYRHIVGPVAGQLEGKRHVFIAASGSLTSLPFGLLVIEPPQGNDADPAALRATRWFADAHALIQIPSVQSLQFLRRFRTDAARGSGFIGFGDPILGGQSVRRGIDRTRGVPEADELFSERRSSSGLRLADVRHLNRLSRLPGTAVELEQMRAALGAPANALFLGERATESTLRRLDLSGVRILALATHGVMAGELQSSFEPGLVFTPPAVPSEQDDGLLTASEVAALRLDADWVILSACNTAAGDGTEGAPGLSGLARAFFYAGARNLLASHWPVRDDVASRLTVRTIAIQREQPGLSRAEAFQRAMREIREDSSHDTAEDSWAHPNAWAPFTLIGDGAR